MHEYFCTLSIGRTFRLLYSNEKLGWLTKVSKQIAITQNGERLRIKPHQGIRTLSEEKQA